MNDGMPTQVAASTAPNIDELLHQIYQTALDYSQWPETIRAVCRELERIEESENDTDKVLRQLQAHFARGNQILDRITTNIEKLEIYEQLLKRLSIGVWLFDDSGGLLFGNELQSGWQDEDHIRNKKKSLSISMMKACRRDGYLLVKPNSASKDSVLVLYAADQIPGHRLPNRVKWLMVGLDQDPQKYVEHLSIRYQLAPSRRRLIESLIRNANLRMASEELSISYETARTYLKDIYQILAVNGQSELLKAALLNPVNLALDFLPRKQPKEIRKINYRTDGTRIEYFKLGEPDAYPIVHYDALNGSALDIFANPERYLKLLKQLNVRLIIPCSPGNFRTEFRKMHSARDYAKDLKVICESMQVRRFSVLAYSHGTVPALGAAFEMQASIDRVVLSSIFYPNYGTPDWRKLDFSSQIDYVIGKRWPQILPQLIPFLYKSLLLDIDNSFAAATVSVTGNREEDLPLTPDVRLRRRETLAQKIAYGTKGIVQDHQIIANQLDFELSELSVPLLLFHGDRDQINPFEGAVALANAAPKTRLTPVPDRGHAFIHTEWEWLIAAAAGAKYSIPPANSPRRSTSVKMG